MQYKPPGLIKKIYFQKLTFGDDPFRWERAWLRLERPAQPAWPPRRRRPRSGDGRPRLSLPCGRPREPPLLVPPPARSPAGWRASEWTRSCRTRSAWRCAHFMKKRPSRCVPRLHPSRLSASSPRRPAPVACPRSPRCCIPPWLRAQPPLLRPHPCPQPPGGLPLGGRRQHLPGHRAARRRLRHAHGPQGVQPGGQVRGSPGEGERGAPAAPPLFVFGRFGQAPLCLLCDRRAPWLPF